LDPIDHAEAEEGVEEMAMMSGGNGDGVSEDGDNGNAGDDEDDGDAFTDAE
jgi:hypothetical protein